MNLQEWNNLTPSEQDKLVIKYGITRKGNRELYTEYELIKIPEVKEVQVVVAPELDKEEIKKIIVKKDVKVKKPIVKLGTKKPVKRSIVKRQLGKKR
jgi:hypothetical protein